VRSLPLSLSGRMRVDGYGVQARSNTESFPTEVGEPMTRVRFTGEQEDMRCSMRLSLDEYMDLLNFWRYDLAHGSQPFIADHPETMRVCVMNFLGRAPQRGALRRGRFSVELELHVTL